MRSCAARACNSTRLFGDTAHTEAASSWWNMGKRWDASAVSPTQ